MRGVVGFEEFSPSTPLFGIGLLNKIFEVFVSEVEEDGFGFDALMIFGAFFVSFGVVLTFDGFSTFVLLLAFVTFDVMLLTFVTFDVLLLTFVIFDALLLAFVTFDALLLAFVTFVVFGVLLAFTGLPRFDVRFLALLRLVTEVTELTLVTEVTGCTFLIVGVDVVEPFEVFEVLLLSFARLVGGDKYVNQNSVPLRFVFNWNCCTFLSSQTIATKFGFRKKNFQFDCLDTSQKYLTSDLIS